MTGKVNDDWDYNLQSISNKELKTPVSFRNSSIKYNRDLTVGDIRATTFKLGS